MTMAVRISSNDDLLARCLDGDPTAWRLLLTRHDQGLRLRIRFLLSRKGFRDRELVDEITGEVWSSLVEQKYRRLRAYDPARAEFQAFLGAVAFGVVRRYFQARDRQREVPLEQAPRNELRDSGRPIELLVDDLLPTLSRQEARLLQMMLRPDAEGILRKSFSPANFWKLSQRLRQKIHVLFAQD
jgi:hypothetical protein